MQHTTSNTGTQSPVSERADREPRMPGLAWPALLPFARVGLVALSWLATMGVLALLGQPSGIPAAAAYSPLALLPVNILSLLLVRRLVSREGSTLRELAGFDRSRLGRDLLWGLLWLMVLYVPFALAIIGTMFALEGGDAFTSFGTVFAPDPAELPALAPAAAMVSGIVVVLTFAPLNAPAEEFVFRGYSQGRLQARFPVLAVLLPSVAFGLQHIFFASTPAAMVVFAVAFFVWGLGSALIFRWQRRLMPLIVAHVLVNLVTSAPALILPFVLPA
ncbi:CPBP family intramembrane glutamic endopeptidase [Cryobacterium sp. BB307]|uniref:CPBP family glutamic-type intramembrane protease n=1 Tax=Cryobacterium sp. BB307 TaxID=2716317 RepID=UPI0014488AEE